MDEAWQSAMDWVEIEHEVYEGDKFDRDQDDLKTGMQWETRITMYLRRATVLGLDNPLGRQAVGKAATTAVAYLESMFRRFGDVPAPGFTSGEHRGDFGGGDPHGREEEAERKD